MTTADVILSGGLGTSFTHYPRDNARAASLMRLAKAEGCEAEVRAYILERRKAWKEWITVQQRFWQSKPRRVTNRRVEYVRRLWGSTHTPERVRECLLDNLAGAEKYVRCS